MKTFYNIIIFVITFSLTFFSPYQVRANQIKSNAQSEKIKSILKNSKYKSGGSIKSWLDHNSQSIHYKLQAKLLRLQLSEPSLKLPQIDVQSLKSDGKEISRLIFKGGREQVIIDIYQKNGQAYARIDGQEFNYNDYYYDILDSAADINPMLTLDQLQKAQSVNPQAALNYQVHFRAFMNALTELEEKNNTKKSQEYSYFDYLIGKAQASELDGKCVVGGFVSEISKTAGTLGQCGGDDKDKGRLYCDGKSISSGFKCNPLVYGFQSDKPICVEHQPQAKPAVYVSEKCNAAYPLDTAESQKAFVDGILKNKDQLAVGDEASFFNQLKDHIRSASLGCGVDPKQVEQRLLQDNPQRFTDQEFEKAFPIRKTKDGKDYNLGHRTACKFLMNRLMLAKTAADCTQKKVLASESPLKEEVAAVNKQCPDNVDVAVIDSPDLAKSCEATKSEAAQVLADIQNKKTDHNDPRISVITQRAEEINSKKYNCVIAGWPPKAPVSQPVDMAQTATAQSNPIAAKKEPWFCARSTGHKIGCTVTAAALICLLIGCFDGKKKKVKQVTVGKPGEDGIERGSTSDPNDPQDRRRGPYTPFTEPTRGIYEN